MSNTDKTFNEAWKELADAVSEASKQLKVSIEEATEQVKRGMSCKTRRFQVIDTYPRQVVAEGVIFSDGSVVLHWKERASTHFYASMRDYDAERDVGHMVQDIDAAQS